jgi:alkylation response protein AidB-like acyl-CoA dehydrogenase
MELQPTTEAGRQLIEIIDGHFDSFLARASDHDRESSFPVESFEDLKRSGVVGAFVPTDLGGFGLESVRDWAIVIERLARSDASIAIGLNMHFGVSRTVAMGLLGSRASEDAAGIARGEGMLRAVAKGDLIICATATEPGTDFLRPNTIATRTEDGWSISGRKIFVTMSPVATLFALNLRVPDPDAGTDRIGFAFIPVGTPGITPQNDWDALGMRASGSQSVVLDDCRVPEGSIQLAGNWGEWNPGILMGRTLGNVTLTGAFLGIAERA